MSLVFASATVAPTHAAGVNTLAQQRADFIAARKALDAGDMKTYRHLSAQLHGYPLFPYLRYGELIDRVPDTPESEIRDFLDRYSDSVVSSRLRVAWLHTLISTKQWRTYLEEYRPYADEQGVALHCYKLFAHYQLAGGQNIPPDWLAEVQSLWLTGKPLPDECDTIFSRWRADGHLTKDLVWQRIQLAMDNRQTEFADQLAKGLDTAGRQWVQRFQRMHKNPEDMLGHADFKADNAKARDILRHGIKRLARNDALLAAERWQQIKARHAFRKEDIAATEREIALSAALQHQPQALDWLAAVSPALADERVRHWRVRVALAQQNWSAALSWLDALPPAERESERWRYWRARILEQLGPTIANAAPQSSAQLIFAELAEQRSYYGFLAADRIKKPYEMQSQPILYTESELAAVNALPGITRCYELYQLDRVGEVRREWDYVISGLSERERQLAAVLASRWGWHERSISTLSKTQHKNDLELRFPLLFHDQVSAGAEQHDIDPAWVYSVIRQESSFMPEARSSAGALGLMQLMPATGKSMAKLLDSPIRHINELLGIDKNIQIGSAYLRRVLDSNDGHQAMATASYNAGPQRIKQWRPDATQSADIWVENIPFTETRNYVQQVMAYSAIFGQRLGRTIVPLRERMPDVAPPPNK